MHLSSGQRRFTDSPNSGIKSGTISSSGQYTNMFTHLSSSLIEWIFEMMRMGQCDVCSVTVASL
jgi:hypothetical protein